jgi:hypothetical protein
LGFKVILNTEGELLMKTSLSALLVGLVILSGAGIAQAADVTQANSQRKADSTPIVVADPKTPKTEVPQAHDRVALTDDQMGKITAGHATGWVHYGQFFDWNGYSWIGWHY